MRIEEKFRELAEKDQGAYMPHVYYGDPTEEFSRKQIETLAENGADLIEFGIPFSDPTADGPTFQAACDRALANGTTPEGCIEGIEELRDGGLEIPIVVTTYYNIPHVFGVGEFVEEIEGAGAGGLIVPNVPIEEADELLNHCRRAGIDLILQVTPNSSGKRIGRIASSASGFIYVVNVAGVTGVRTEVPDSTKKLIREVKNRTDVPLMAGFGISRKEEAESIVAAGADGVITGSALGKIYEENLENPEEKLSKIGEFAREIKEGCSTGYSKKE